MPGAAKQVAEAVSFVSEVSSKPELFLDDSASKKLKSKATDTTKLIFDYGKET
jgi:hypothetical protein